MTHTTTPTPRHHTNSRRIRRTIGYAIVRGAAQATGTGLIGLLFWWLTHK